MTLIELMITVAIVALLAAVALPAYQGSVRKARRADAKAALTVAAQRMERSFTENGGYAGATIGTRSTDTIPQDSENKYYTLSFLPSSLTRSTYTLVATPQGAQVEDACKKFTLNQRNDRGNLDLSNNPLSLTECW